MLGTRKRGHGAPCPPSKSGSTPVILGFCDAGEKDVGRDSLGTALETHELDDNVISGFKSLDYVEEFKCIGDLFPVGLSDDIRSALLLAVKARLLREASGVDGNHEC